MLMSDQRGEKVERIVGFEWGIEEYQRRPVLLHFSLLQTCMPQTTVHSLLTL